MAYRVAICDDSVTDAFYVQDILNNWAKERHVRIQAEVFPSAESFMFRYAEDKDYDILLLDIEMGAMDGVTMAKRVRQNNEAVQIVFITGYGDYMAQGYEVAALHYLMKPVETDKLFAVLDRAIANIQKADRVVLLPLDGLDNAMEACLNQGEKSERFIRVYIGVLKKQLYISVTNSVCGSVHKSGKNYLSTKKTDNHGFGLMRVDRIAEKYGGYVNRQDEPGVFATEIMLPL